MPSLVIKKLPEEIHRKLKTQAQHHHRSMVKEAIALLEEALDVKSQVREIPPPYEGKLKLTNRFINDAKRRGRS